MPVPLLWLVLRAWGLMAISSHLIYNSKKSKYLCGACHTSLTDSLLFNSAISTMRKGSPVSPSVTL
jgi:hypothetical protein